MEEKIFLFDCEKKYTIAEIKNLGLNRSEENLQKLLEIFPIVEDIEIKREIVSSIGRQNNNEKIFDFIKNNVYNGGFVDLFYQMYRTCLYKGRTDENFKTLGEEIKNLRRFFHFENRLDLARFATRLRQMGYGSPKIYALAEEGDLEKNSRYSDLYFRYALKLSH